jgi:ring-1,2-phenylacetyl-CoA epoxidase subunit PaaE
MILGVKDAFVEAGFDSKNIHFELFGTNTPVKEKQVLTDEVVTSLVTVIVDGEVLDIPLASNDVNILDAALEAGADLPFACKGGVCCTCKAKIMEGSAKMDVNYALEPDEVEAGYILTCQSHPTSERLIVSFDE